MQNIIIFLAQYLIFCIAFLGVVAWAFAPKQQKIAIAATAVIAIIVGLAMAKLVGHFYYHPRPFVVDGILPLVYHDASTSFPSEHALAAFIIAFTLLRYTYAWGVPLLICAILVGVGRVAAHVHWPLDIIGGVIFAAIAVLFAQYVVGLLRARGLLFDKSA